MKGILKNRDEGNIDADVDTAAHFDRKTVIENTRRNAHLRATRGDDSNDDDNDTGDHHHNRTAVSPLRWDEKNLIINEREKSATMKIDEPKTPYEGGFDPNNDYYKDDDDDDDAADDELVLGDPEDDAEFPPEVIERAEGVEEEEETKEKEEPKEDIKEEPSSFERMRKMHYKMEAKVRPPDDEDDEEDL